MSSNDLKAWLLLAGFEFNRTRYFYLSSGPGKIAITTVFMEGAVEVCSLVDEQLHVFLDCAEAQQYIQTIIGD